MNTLQADEHIVLIFGGFPNKRGHILVHDWLAVSLRGHTVQDIQQLPELLSRITLKPGKLTNPGIVGDTSKLQPLLPLTIEQAKQALQKRRLEIQGKLAAKLLAQHDKLKALKVQHLQQMELDFGHSDLPEAFKRKKHEDRMSHVDRVFKDHLDWLENTQTTEDEPFLQVAAVLTGDRGQSRSGSRTNAFGILHGGRIYYGCT